MMMQLFLKTVMQQDASATEEKVSGQNLTSEMWV